jgi:hypothetical protein
MDQAPVRAKEKLLVYSGSFFYVDICYAQLRGASGRKGTKLPPST